MASMFCVTAMSRQSVVVPVAFVVHEQVEEVFNVGIGCLHAILGGVTKPKVALVTTGRIPTQSSGLLLLTS